MQNKPKSVFYQRVYAAVAKIPAGAVTTYGRVAWMAGSPWAARQVGYAMSAVDERSGLPCHRVVNRLGELAPEHVFGGKGVQRMLLAREGVTFLPDGRIDLEKHLWSSPAKKARVRGTGGTSVM